MTMMVEPRMESTQPTLPCRLSFSFRTWEERRALWGEGRGGGGGGGGEGGESVRVSERGMCVCMCVCV